MELGQVIRALRKKRGDTLEKVALEAGTDASNLSRIERGVQQPSMELLRSLAAALQTSQANLLACAEGRGDSPEFAREMLGIDDMDFTKEAIQLRRQFRALSPENQRLAVELLRVLNRMQKDR